MANEYIIYCDESTESGRHFSNFYGGVLVRSEHIDEIRRALGEIKRNLNFFGEVKWQKITEPYAEKYIRLMDAFFDLVMADRIKVRIMFTQNTVIAKNLSPAHVEEKYFILYYQFIKHAFGLIYSPALPGGVDLRIYPDKLPDTREQVEKFRSFLLSLTENREFRRRDIRVRRENIAEVRSHDHDLLQCLDIVLGAMQFRLNDRHLDRPAGARRRGKRTIAKERVYRYINTRIQAIYPRFNIGISTGHQGEDANRWKHPYRHWLFMPTERIVRPGSKRPKR